MIDEDLDEGWSMLTTARGVGLAVRALILTAPLMALAATSAASRTVPAINLAVLGATMFCILRPDSHIGLLVVVLIGGQWLATVDSPTTPWSVAAATALAVFHTALAAASAIPPGAVWSSAMVGRWSRRAAVAIATSATTWAALVVIDRVDLGTSSILVTTSLLVLAAGGLWARDGTLGSRRRGTQP